MTNEPQNDIDATALDWAVRTADADFADWEGFARWLALDERHADRYDVYAGVAADAAQLLASHSPATVSVESRPRWGRVYWIGGAGAAAIAAALALVVLPSGPQPYVIETQPGTVRTVTLQDGSAVELAGGTRVTLDRVDPRVAAVEQGEAMFTVHHDAARPFRVTVGQIELLDVGTAFDVKRDPSSVRVAVSDGEVLFNPAREAIRLPRGRGILVDTATRRATVAPIDTGAVGGWRSGQLSYDGAPLAEVVADLSRAGGRPVSVSPPLARRRFHGTIDVRTVRADPMRLADILGVTVRDTGSAWELTERH